MALKLFFIFFLSLVNVAHASIPMTPSGTEYIAYVWGSYNNGYRSTKQQACSALIGISKLESYATYTVVSSSLIGENTCGLTIRYAIANGTSTSNENATIYSRQTPPKCPENSTQSGNVCVCNSGYAESNDSCVENNPCEGLADYCKDYANTEREWTQKGVTSRPTSVCYKPISIMVGAGGGQLDRFPGCNRGCNIDTSPGVVKYDNGDGQTMVTGYGVFSGADCSFKDDTNVDKPDNQDNKADEPDKSCPNGFKGIVNGVEVCVPPKSASGITEMEMKDNGDGTKTNTQTEVKCEGGKCEITKTSTTTNSSTNATVSNSSVTTTVDKKTFCSENKTAAVCKNEDGENEDGDGKFGGSCDAGFECKGDAVMCAMAKEQHKRSCETLEPVKDGIFKQIEEGTDSGSADAMKEGAGEINISTQLDTSGYGLPRSCPSDPVIDLPFVGKTFTIPFSQACPILKTMSDVALLITALGLLVWLVAPRGKAE